MKSIHDLTDDELEDCVDGSTSIEMIRDILTKTGVINNDGLLDSEEFAGWFAYGLEGYIDAEEDTDEWQEAYDANWSWGQDIADNINDYISEDSEE